MKNSFLSVFIAVLVGGIASNLCSSARAYAADECVVDKNGGGIYESPVTVVLGQPDEPEKASARFNVHFFVKADDTDPRYRQRLVADTDTGIAKFRVSRSYGAVMVYGYGKDGTQQCESELKYTITDGAAPAPRPAASKTKAVVVAATSSDPGPVTYVYEKVGERTMLVPRLIGFYCTRFNTGVATGVPQLACANWERVDIDVVAEQAVQGAKVATLEASAIPRETESGQGNLFRIGASFVGLAGLGMGGLAFGQADLNLSGSRRYLSIRGDIGGVSDEHSFVGCLSGGFTGATDGDRTVYVSVLGGWCGVLAEDGRFDLANLSVPVLMQVADGFGVELRPMGGVLVEDGVGNDGKEETEVRFSIGGTAGVVGTF